MLRIVIVTLVSLYRTESLCVEFLEPVSKTLKVVIQSHASGEESRF